ncbi:MAG TPA: hypothetical protein VF281_03470 [Candidatus Saccharimonadales bacterium]
MASDSVINPDSLMHDIRELVNKSIFIENIERHNFKWDMAIASMDTIEDTELAIKSYSSLFKDLPEGQLYLILYGLFQAIFMQQDAVIHLAKGLNSTEISIWKDVDGKKIRVLRNKYFGHPTDSQNYKTKESTFHGLTRITLSAKTVTGWTYPNFSTELIDISDVIKIQQKFIIRSLINIQNDLRKKELKFMRQFKNELPEDDLTYPLGKIWTWAVSDSDNAGDVAPMGVSMLSRFINNTEKELKERFDNLHGIDAERDIAKAKYCLEQIRKMMAIYPKNANHSFEADIYVTALQDVCKTLKTLNTDINKQFRKASSNH